jgi:hypothetical protein
MSEPLDLSGPQRLSADEFVLIRAYRVCSNAEKEDIRLFALAASQHRETPTPVDLEPAREKA